MVNLYNLHVNLSSSLKWIFFQRNICTKLPLFPNLIFAVFPINHILQGREINEADYGLYEQGYIARLGIIKARIIPKKILSSKEQAAGIRNLYSCPGGGSLFCCCYFLAAFTRQTLTKAGGSACNIFQPRRRLSVDKLLLISEGHKHEMGEAV